MLRLKRFEQGLESGQRRCRISEREDSPARHFAKTFAKHCTSREVEDDLRNAGR